MQSSNVTTNRNDCVQKCKQLTLNIQWLLAFIIYNIYIGRKGSSWGAIYISIFFFILLYYTLLHYTKCCWCNFHQIFVRILLSCWQRISSYPWSFYIKDSESFVAELRSLRRRNRIFCHLSSIRVFLCCVVCSELKIVFQRKNRINLRKWPCDGMYDFCGLLLRQGCISQLTFDFIGAIVRLPTKVANQLL